MLFCNKRSAPYPEDVLPEIRRQQHIYLTNLTPIISGFNVANGTLVAFLFWNLVDHVIVLSWYALLLMGPILQMRGWLKVRGRPVPAKITGKTLERAKLWSILLGAIWGTTALIFFTPESVPHQMFLAVLIGGMTSGAVALLNPLPDLNWRYLIAVLTPLILRFLWEGHSIHMTVAFMAMVLGVALYKGSEQSFAQFARIISFSRQLEVARAYLVNAIESTNDAFAIFSENGELSIANRRFLKWFPGMTHAPVTDTEQNVYRFVEGRWVQSSLRPIEGGGFVSVHTDVTELKEREDKLVAANREAERARHQAEEANRAKTEFLANMSHELRTPLNAIMGFSEVMQSEMFGPLGSERYKSYTIDIHKSASHLLSIISDILDLSKIESSNYKITPERADLREVIDWVKSMTGQKQVTGAVRNIEVSVAAGVCDVEVDLRAIKQVLLNLINNALKFTPDDGSIGIAVSLGEGGETIINVWDTGIGIPKDKLEWVRQPFHQFEGVFHKKYQGTGLGLSISESLVALHGGRIDIESEVNKGTQVKVVLPPERRLSPVGAGKAAAIA